MFRMWRHKRLASQLIRVVSNISNILKSKPKWWYQLNVQCLQLVDQLLFVYNKYKNNKFVWLLSVNNKMVYYDKSIQWPMIGLNRRRESRLMMHHIYQTIGIRIFHPKQKNNNITLISESDYFILPLWPLKVQSNKKLSKLMQ